MYKMNGLVRGAALALAAALVLAACVRNEGIGSGNAGAGGASSVPETPASGAQAVAPADGGGNAAAGAASSVPETPVSLAQATAPGDSGGNAAARTASSLIEALASGNRSAIETALAGLTSSVLAEVTGKSGSPGGDFSYDLNKAGNGIVIRKYSGPGGVVVIPETIEDIPVVEIGNGAFYQDTRITSVVLPPGTKIIGPTAFGNCTRLTAVILPAGLEELGEYVFSGCPSLHTANIPEGIKIIGAWVFSECGELYNLSIPSSLTTIWWGESIIGHNESFYGCGKLKLATRQRLKDLGYGGSFVNN